jgi:hypothetical protein
MSPDVSTAIRCLAAVHESVSGRHFSDMPGRPDDVRCWRQSGRHLLAVSISGIGPTADIRPHQLLTPVAYQFSQGRKVVPLRLGVQFAFDGLLATGSRRNCSVWIVGNQLQQIRNGRLDGKEFTKMAYRHDAMLPSTPSRRIRPWKSAAPKCARKVAKNR